MKTAMLLIGGLAVAYFLGNKPGAEDQEEPVEKQIIIGANSMGGSGGSTLRQLLDADLNSSGVGAFNQTPTDQGEGLLSRFGDLFSMFAAGFSGDSAGDAIELDADSVVNEWSVVIDGTPKAITGSLSPFFMQLGQTTSEISGNAIRQVGLLMPGEDVLLTSTSKISVADTNALLTDETNPLELTETIQVLPSNQPTPTVFTRQGGDGTDVVLQQLNFSSVPFYTTLETLKAAHEQGHFNPRPTYVPRSLDEIAADWAASEEGIASAAKIAQQSEDNWAYVASVSSKETTEAPLPVNSRGFVSSPVALGNFAGTDASDVAYWSGIADG